MNHILFLTEAPFRERDYHRFGVQRLRENFQVSILDCTPWIKPDFWERYSTIAYPFPGNVAIGDFDSLISFIDRHTECVAIDFLGNCSKCAKVRLALKSRKIPRVVFLHGLLPRPERTWNDRLRRLISGNSPTSLLKLLKTRSERILHPEPMPELALMSGTAGLNDPRARGAAERLWAHSLDYDIYLENRSAPLKRDEPYAVFLDEDMLYHPDYDHSGITPPTTARAYYSAMNRFFEKIEPVIGMPVIVAAHPVSKYDVRPELWDGRETISGKTAELVRGASLVFCHLSTSLGFAILWRKPIVFLTTDDLRKSFLGSGIALRSTLLDAPLLNVDADANRLSGLKLSYGVNERAYAKYVADYIKRPGTPDTPVWQLFSDFVRAKYR
ncbi:MAG TPA: hypothetical protein VFS56_01245 [Gemmatimonadaceae bacterium]|nr:hypothetical protein [Gemmatimonadaceae bacterium]